MNPVIITIDADDHKVLQINKQIHDAKGKYFLGSFFDAMKYNVKEYTE